jgi:hypothetical protein
MTKILTSIILSLTIVSLGGLGLSAVPALAALGGSDIRQDIDDNLEPIERFMTPRRFRQRRTGSNLAKLIQVALGFLGIVFLVLILYAGFNWMTSAAMRKKFPLPKKPW